MRKLKLLMAACALVGSAATAWAQATWTDKTSLITNPSFETDAAIADLTNSANRTVPTGWSLTYDTGASNNTTQQWGTANSTSSIYSKDGTGTFTPSAGEKFFHLRENWHGSTTYELYQTIPAENLPAGIYKLTAKMATSASAATDYTLTIQEEGGTAVVAKQNTGVNAYAWQDWSVVVYKSSASTTLTIKATMKGGSAGSSHWCMLLDDFKLEYAAQGSVSTSNTLDMTAAIVNPSFEWGNTQGWTTTGGTDTGAKLNSNATYATTGADGSYVYNTWQSSSTLFKVSQTIKGLPDGYYQVTALVASDANQHIQVYCGNGKVYDTSTDKATGKDITTPVAYVSGGQVEIGATSYNWFKTDNFRLYYLGTDFTPSTETPLAITDKASLAWNVGGTTVQWGIQLRETYSTDPTTIADDVLTQTITGLDNGNYRVKLWAEASYAKNNGVADSDVPAGTHVATLYANDATANVNLENQTGVAGGTLNSYTLDAQVTTHSLKIGMNAIAAGANWKIIQIENLLYTGPLDLSSYKSTYDALVSEAGTAKTEHSIVVGKELTDLNAALDETFDTTSPDAYEDINTRLRTLIDVFVAAEADYTLLSTEKSKATALGMTASEISTATPNTLTGLGATQSLKVAEYNFVTTTYQYGVSLGEWTSTGTNTKAANFSNEHWSGTTHAYKNQDDSNGQGWNASSWSINFNQDVTLPAGNYVFKVAGRQASGDQVTTSLVVKLNEEELGSVNDFPRSNNARGINKSGETAFDGENDDFANNGNGYGWEWRYVKFHLDEDATVNIAVNSVATAIHQWVSFGDYTLQTDNEANIALIAYNVALNNARTLRDDDTYANVQGTDRSNLVAAISADASLDKSDKDDIETATTNLNTAAATFTAGVASWNTYAMVKDYADEIDAVALPYASTEKITAVTTAKNSTVDTAADAVTQTATINTANRAAYESNALAEGVATAVNVSNIIQNADGSATTGWSGSFWTASGEPYTEADGNTTNTYFDKNGVKSFETSQTIHLLKGNYILSVTARAQAGINSFKMQATNNADETEEISLTAMGNANGVFNRGWNNFTLAFEQKADGDATIKIVGDNTTNNANFWMSWDRFRLMALSALTEGIAVTEAGYATYVSNYDLDYSSVSGLTAYKATVDGQTITFTKATTVPAGEGVLLKGDAGSYSVPVTTGIAAWADDDNAFIRGTGEAVETGDGPYNYILNNIEGVVGFYKANGQMVATNRAYLQSAESAARLNIFFDDETTGISTVKTMQNSNGIYNLNGQKVEKAGKGLYIMRSAEGRLQGKNGKKVIMK